MDTDFPTIQRGNGINNDNLATLRDILVALHKKTHELEATVGITNREVAEVKNTITSIDAKNAWRSSWSFYLLVLTTILGLAGVIIAYLTLVGH